MKDPASVGPANKNAGQILAHHSESPRGFQDYIFSQAPWDGSGPGLTEKELGSLTRAGKVSGLRTWPRDRLCQASCGCSPMPLDPEVSWATIPVR
jgi:hypothetical protein